MPQLKGYTQFAKFESEDGVINTVHANSNKGQSYVMLMKTMFVNQFIHSSLFQLKRPLHIAPTKHQQHDIQRWVWAWNAFILTHLLLGNLAQFVAQFLSISPIFFFLSLSTYMFHSYFQSSIQHIHMSSVYMSQAAVNTQRHFDMGFHYQHRHW